MDHFDRWTSVLGNKNPFSRKARPGDHIIWLLDNAAYQPVRPGSQGPQAWQAEFIACYFTKNSKSLKKKVGAIAFALGIDTKKTSNHGVTTRIANRLEPFVNPIAPARRVTITIPDPAGTPHIRELGPSNSQGISVQTLTVSHGANIPIGTVIESTTVEPFIHPVLGKTRFISPTGWSIISDIDDTIKQTILADDPTGILRSTFASAHPQPITDMPSLYTLINTRFHDPAWFYLSASPYNLYPFLGHFLTTSSYPPGVLILRDNSWQNLFGLLRSLTQDVKTYKTTRMNRIRSMFPRRKVICFGDSTQSDPEAYADMYRQYTSSNRRNARTRINGTSTRTSADEEAPWIRAIFIRRVTYVDDAEEKNRPERFEKAFRGVPHRVWMVFERPEECVGRLMELLDEEGGNGEEGQ